MFLYTLGPLPWTEEILTNAHFNNFQAARSAIKEHPGYLIHAAIASLKKSYSIFQASVSDLFRACQDFEEASVSSTLLGRPFRDKYERLVLAVEKELFSTCCAAMALVDHSRNIQRVWPVTDYSGQMSETFSNEHEFVQCLRNYVNHNRTAPLAWQQNWRFDNSAPTTTFSLRREALMRTGAKWSSGAKLFLSAQPENINIRNIFEDYRKRATSFHEWFIFEVEKLNKSNVEEYRKHERFLNAISSRSTWNVMIQQVKNGKADIEKSLGWYLTPAELDKFMALTSPRDQADYLIDTLDEYGACDDAMRAQVYDIFKVSNA